MFESVTKKRKNPIYNIIGWTLLAVCCVVFIFLGLTPSNTGLVRGGAAGHVNGDAISLRDFKQLLDRLDNSQNGARDGGRRVEENAMNILISRELIVQEAEKLNIYVSDEEVGQELLDIDAFYDDGVFSKILYKNYLRQARMDEGEFEDKIRRDLLIQKMSGIVGFAAKEVKLVDEFDEKIEQAQLNVAYAALSPEALKTKGASGSEQKAYLESNKADIEKYYNSHKSEFTLQEKVTARHILIKPKDEKKESQDAALAKVKNIAKDLTVKNFSEMAKKHSDDPGSKTQGGSLGEFGRGRMVPAFDKAVFAAEVGAITEPVKSKFGYHIILVDKKQEAKEKKLEEVQEDIAKTLIAKNRFDKVAKEVKETLKEKKFGELESLLKEHKLSWTNTGFFNITRENIPGIGQHKDFLDTAMTLGPEKEYADQLVYKGDMAYLIKFTGAKMNAAQKQNGQMDFFKQLMRQQRMNSIVQSWADSLREKASVKINPSLVQ